MPVDHVVPANGPDWFGDFVVDPMLTRNRYVKAIELRPSKDALKAVHHINLIVQDPDDTTSGQSAFLQTYEPGGNSDVYSDGFGYLLKARARIRFNMHYHSYGEQTTDRSSVGFVFYPEGEVPKYPALVKVFDAGVEPGDLLPPRGLAIGKKLDLDIPAGATNIRHDGYHRMAKPVRITAFQPHLHERGKAACLEAILPDGRTEAINCVDRYDFMWQVNYLYAEDSAPLLPAGTILHLTTWHDNSTTAKYNPDPSNWVGWGQRSLDEMAQTILKIVELSEEEFRAQVASRDAAKGKSTTQQ
jgi:hypothetical protein